MFKYRTGPNIAARLMRTSTFFRKMNPRTRERALLRLSNRLEAKTPIPRETSLLGSIFGCSENIWFKIGINHFPLSPVPSSVGDFVAASSVPKKTDNTELL